MARLSSEPGMVSTPKSKAVLPPNMRGLAVRRTRGPGRLELLRMADDDRGAARPW